MLLISRFVVDKGAYEWVSGAEEKWQKLDLPQAISARVAKVSPGLGGNYP
ncbi:hypothetical protein [Ferrimonas balearica]|nr:hypothetical protein [Ferrimonas balearica]MBY5990905.1 hypothetical protein [Ferrimonas balearica]